MALIDFMLNVAGLLLWLSWLSLGFDPLARTRAASLLGTIRRTEGHRFQGWFLLASLGGLIFARALLYWELGPAADWTPKLNLGPVVLPFRSDRLGVVTIFSILSFARVLAICYFWLVILHLVNRAVPEAEPLQKWVRLHLGRGARWSAFVLLLLPILAVAACWAGLYPLLVYLEVVSRVREIVSILPQGLSIGGALYLTLKYLLPVILLLHLVTSYVYLGSNNFWDYISLTSRSLLRPLGSVPMKIGRVDFSPVLAVVLVAFLLEVLPMLLLRFYPSLRVVIWPQ